MAPGAGEAAGGPHESSAAAGRSADSAAVPPAATHSLASASQKATASEGPTPRDSCSEASADTCGGSSSVALAAEDASACGSSQGASRTPPSGSSASGAAGDAASGLCTLGSSRVSACSGDEAPPDAGTPQRAAKRSDGPGCARGEGAAAGAPNAPAPMGAAAAGGGEGGGGGEAGVAPAPAGAALHDLSVAGLQAAGGLGGGEQPEFRICLASERPEALVAACNCIGSVRFAHVDCLEVRGLVAHMRSRFPWNRQSFLQGSQEPVWPRGTLWGPALRQSVLV